MRLTILGSAAAEGWPALFCTCEACAEARRLGGKNVRRRTSYRLGDRIQIDWGPDTTAACLDLGLPLDGLTDVVVTHAHEDHWSPHELYYRRDGFSRVPADAVLTVHGPPGVGERLTDTLGEDLSPFKARFDALQTYETRTVAGGVGFTPIPAAHATNIGGAHNYIIDVQGRTLLLANDTGWWEEEVWRYLADAAFDTVIMDCTYGFRDATGGHLGCPNVVQAKQKLQAQGSLAPDCRFIANHFSHNGEWLHAQLEEFFAPAGVEVGYDGMVVEV